MQEEEIAKKYYDIKVLKVDDVNLNTDEGVSQSWEGERDISYEIDCFKKYQENILLLSVAIQHKGPYWQYEKSMIDQEENGDWFLHLSNGKRIVVYLMEDKYYRCIYGREYIEILKKDKVEYVPVYVMSFGRLFRDLMGNYNICTQEELADYLGVTQGTLNKYLNEDDNDYGETLVAPWDKQLKIVEAFQGYMLNQTRYGLREDLSEKQLELAQMAQEISQFINYDNYESTLNFEWVMKYEDPDTRDEYEKNQEFEAFLKTLSTETLERVIRMLPHICDINLIFSEKIGKYLELKCENSSSYASLMEDFSVKMPSYTDIKEENRSDYEMFFDRLCIAAELKGFQGVKHIDYKTINKMTKKEQRIRNQLLNEIFVFNRYAKAMLLNCEINADYFVKRYLKDYLSLDGQDWYNLAMIKAYEIENGKEGVMDILRQHLC